MVYDDVQIFSIGFKKIMIMSKYFVIISKNVQECVELFAFPPNKMCIKPIHTDVHVSGLIKK